MTPRRPAMGFIFITLVLDVLGIGLIIPVAPKLIEQLLGRGEAAAAEYVALLTATYAAMQFVFAPILGALSDRFGRRPVILVSLLGSGLDYFAMALVPNLAWLFVTRALNGISGANMTAAAAYIADVTPPERRAAGYGMMGAAFGLGFVLGPLAGGLLGQIDIHYPFYAAGALTLLNWLYGLFVLPESLPRERRSSFSFARANPIGALFGLGGSPVVAGLAGALFLMNLAQFGLHATWVLYTGHRYGWGPRDVGLSLMLVGIGAVIVQGGLARILIPRLGERRSLIIGVAIGTLAYIGYGAATDGWMIFVIIALASVGGIAQPAAQAIISKAVPPDAQGKTQGALTSLQSVAQIFGPIIGGAAFAYSIGPSSLDHAGSPLAVPGFTFFVGAALAALGGLLAAVVVYRPATPAGRAAETPHPGT